MLKLDKPEMEEVKATGSFQEGEEEGGGAVVSLALVVNLRFVKA